MERQCDYYVAYDEYGFAVYHKNGQRVSDYFSLPLWLEDLCEVTFNENLGIVEFSYGNGIREIIEFTPLKQETVDTAEKISIEF
jgi:hypothetical protein